MPKMPVWEKVVIVIGIVVAVFYLFVVWAIRRAYPPV